MLLDKYIGSHILPQQHSIPKNVPLEIKERGNCEFNNFMVPSANKAQLDTLEIRPLNLPVNPSYIIYFCGMGGSYTNKIDYYRKRAEQFNHVAICFNYTNVGNSTGSIYNENQLTNDGSAQVERLLNLNVPANKIILFGTSLGGAIAMIVVSQYQRNDVRIRLISDRSFTKFIDALPPKLQKYRFILAPLLRYLKWELNALAASQFIRIEDIFIIVSKDDKVIAYQGASLYQGIKPEMKKFYNTFQHKDCSHVAKIANGVQLNELTGTDEAKYGVHSALLEQLVDKNGNRIAESIFNWFVIQEHAEVEYPANNHFNLGNQLLSY